MIMQLMLREGLAMDGSRPEIRDIYETPRELVEPPNPTSPYSNRNT